MLMDFYEPFGELKGGNEERMRVVDAVKDAVCGCRATAKEEERGMQRQEPQAPAAQCQPIEHRVDGGGGGGRAREGTGTATATTITTSSSRSSSSSSNSEDGDNGEEEEERVIDMLVSLCSSAQDGGTRVCDGRERRRYVSWILGTQSNNDANVAADVILAKIESGQLDADMVQWACCVEKRERVGAAKARVSGGVEGDDDTQNKEQHAEQVLHVVDPELKKSIVSRYHLQAVPKVGPPGKQLDIVARQGDTTSGADAERKMRFRDGVVVSTKGEEYVVEKQPGWDGGSRGRVKSKRKGGKGWH